jgi:hypothetical protein
MVAGLPGPAIFIGPEIDFPSHEAALLIAAGKAFAARPERAVKHPRETR